MLAYIGAVLENKTQAQVHEAVMPVLAYIVAVFLLLSEKRRGEEVALNLSSLYHQMNQKYLWNEFLVAEVMCSILRELGITVFVKSKLSINHLTIWVVCLLHRYGLPVNFQAMLIRPVKKNHKRMREILNGLYGHLDSTALSGQQVSIILII